MYRRAELVMGRPLELLCLYFFACEQRYMRSATPTLVPLYNQVVGTTSTVHPSRITQNHVNQPPVEEDVRLGA